METCVCYPFEVKTSFPFFPNRSLVEDDDAHMKVALGYGDMGISAHLQASKTGNTRFFTSNTHSSVVLQVRVRTCRVDFFFNIVRFLTVPFTDAVNNVCSIALSMKYAD